ncbi:flagellar type III secretion system protein FliQ [bacterium]|nr:flagellar type III secretion system protein FliQ [bacterium]
MEQAVIIGLLQEMFVLIIQLSAPILLTGVLLGLMVSIFQAVTQIQESTLTFVPKIIGGIIVLIILLPWMYSMISSAVNGFFDTIPQLIGGA